MKKINLLIIGTILSTTMAMAEVKADNKGFPEMKAKCTKVISNTLDCMNKATNVMEMKVCKMTQKKDFLDLKIAMMKSGKMKGMMGKGMAKGKCGAGKCGGK